LLDRLTVFYRPDDEIRNKGRGRGDVRRMLLVNPGEVEVAVDGGVVTLAERLDIRASTELAVRFVERLEGVAAVVDRLTSGHDERLVDTTIERWA
jgi:osmotically-inducible protein OsmY